MAVGNAVIGALRVLIGADSAEMETGLKKAQASLDKFGSNVKAAGQAMAVSLGLAFVGLAVAIKGQINEADKLFKMSQKFGVPIEELSALKHAADLSGVSLESLGKSLGKLSRNMMEAAANPTGEAAKAFQALGISVRNADGSLKSNSAVMTEAAEKFSKMKDGAGKTALAIALFGRAGADLIPMLNLGKAGLQEMMKEAEELGIVIDQRTGAAAEAFNDNLTRMKKVFDGIVLKVTAEMLPAFLQFSQVMIDTAKSSELLKQIADTIVSALKWMVSEVLRTIAGLRAFAAEITGLFNFVSIGAEAMAKIIKGAFSFDDKEIRAGLSRMQDAFAAAYEGFAKSSAIIADTEGFIKSFNESAAKSIELLAKKPQPQNDAPIIQGNKDALDKYIDSLKKKNAATLADIQTIGLSEGAHQRLKIMLEAEEIAKANNIVITDKMRASLEATANSTAVLADRLKQSRDQWDNFRGVVLSVRSSLENAFVDAIMQAKSFKEVIRSLIGEFARLAAQQAFRSMFGGTLAWEGLAGKLFGAGGSGAGLAGLAGFASGGSFQVGGSGGIDSQLVAFKASPNERVSITKPGQEMGGGIVVHQTIAPVFHPGMTPTDMASIRSMMSTVAAQTKSDTINTIRGAMSRDSRAFAL